jgi:hypothetical protein
MTVPVLICPVITDFDLVERMLASLDEPIERLVIVDNSLSGWTSQTRPDVRYIRPILGLGYPGGINAGITQTPDAPWWMWCNADLTFARGDLANVAALAEGTGPRMVTGSDRRLRNAYGAMNRAAVEAVGLFDEWSFFPIYYDDDDLERRCHLGGVEWLTYDGGIQHNQSATLVHAEFSEANGRTFPINRQAYIDKWGGLPGRETFTTPWNGDYPLNYCPVDIAGRARRMW